MILRLLIFILVFTLFGPFKLMATSIPYLDTLNAIIKEKIKYDNQKKQRIQELENTLEKCAYHNYEKRYQIYLSLYEEYKTFEFNKAFYYVKNIEELASIDNNSSRLSAAKIKLAFILVSSGMYTESLEALQAVDTELLDSVDKVEFYALLARNYYDLADYTKDEFYAPEYIHKAGKNIAMVLELTDKKSFTHNYYLGLSLLKEGNIEQAQKILIHLLKSKQLSEHQGAIVTSTLSDIYIQKGDLPKAIDLLAAAATSDIKSSTKEAAAMLNLAQLLFQLKDVKNAYVYINEAMDDANYYGARQRKLQVSANLKVIATGKVNSVDEQRRVMTRYTIVLSILIMIIIAFSLIIYRQLIKIRKADIIIRETNKSLHKTIEKLNEADKIKEEYVGYYFNINTAYIDKIELTKKNVENKLKQKDYENIKLFLNKIDPNKERENLYLQFDKTFLRIFPRFIDEFNTLFEEEDHFELPSNGELSTELRIFALIRMGISDNNTIAQVLNYSVNTIYSYKNRIKNKAKVQNNQFEEYIMHIKGI